MAVNYPPRSWSCRETNYDKKGIMELYPKVVAPKPKKGDTPDPYALERAVGKPLAFYLYQALLRDGFTGAWAQVTFINITEKYNILVAHPTKDVSAFFERWLAILDAAIEGAEAYNAGQTLSADAYINFAEQGEQVLNCTGVQLRHFAPSDNNANGAITKFSDYLYRRTAGRFNMCACLGAADPATAPDCCNRIVDVNQLMAPESDAAALAAFDATFDSATKKQLQTLLVGPNFAAKFPQSARTWPIVAQGRYVSEFLWRNYQATIAAQKHITPGGPNPIQVLDVFTLEIVSGRQTPVIIANDMNLWFDNTNNSAILKQDLVSAEFMAKMSVAPDSDPVAVRNESIAAWDDFAVSQVDCTMRSAFDIGGTSEAAKAAVLAGETHTYRASEAFSERPNMYAASGENSHDKDDNFMNTTIGYQASYIKEMFPLEPDMDSALLTLQFYTYQTMLKDGMFGGWAFVKTDYQTIPDRAIINFAAQLTSNTMVNRVNKFPYALQAFLNAGYNGIQHLDKDVFPKKPCPDGVNFSLELGLPLTNISSVQLLHYPPIETQVFADFLYAPTVARWDCLLAQNNLPLPSIGPNERIMDINPLEASGLAGGAKAVQPYDLDSIQYSLDNLALFLANEDLAKHGKTVPMVAYGGPVRDFMWAVWKDQIAAQLNVPVDSKYNPVRVGQVFTLEIIKGLITPTVVSNHPTMFLYDTGVPLPDVSTKNGYYDSPLTVMTDDLICAGWHAHMSQFPLDDPHQTYQNMQARWTPNEKVYEAILMQDLEFGWKTNPWPKPSESQGAQRRHEAHTKDDDAAANEDASASQSSPKKKTGGRKSAVKREASEEANNNEESQKTEKSPSKTPAGKKRSRK